MCPTILPIAGCGEKKWIHNFGKGICVKVNAMKTGLDFELSSLVSCSESLPLAYLNNDTKEILEDLFL